MYVERESLGDIHKENKQCIHTHTYIEAFFVFTSSSSSCNTPMAMMNRKRKKEKVCNARDIHTNRADESRPVISSFVSQCSWRVSVTRYVRAIRCEPFLLSRSVWLRREEVHLDENEIGSCQTHSLFVLLWHFSLSLSRFDPIRLSFCLCSSLHPSTCCTHRYCSMHHKKHETRHPSTSSSSSHHYRSATRSSTLKLTKPIKVKRLAQSTSFRIGIGSSLDCPSFLYLSVCLFLRRWVITTVLIFIHSVWLARCLRVSFLSLSMLTLCDDRWALCVSMPHGSAREKRKNRIDWGVHNQG